MSKGPKRKLPACRSSRLPNTLGESKRGTHNQSTAPSGAINAPVWQSDRKAYSAMGGNGEGKAALVVPTRAPPSSGRGSAVTDGAVAIGTSSADLAPSDRTARPGASSAMGDPLGRSQGARQGAEPTGRGLVDAGGPDDD